MELLDKFQKWSKKTKVFLTLDSCRPVITGGYGLRMLTKHLRRVAPPELTETTDIDIHFNLRDTLYETNPDEFTNMIKQKLKNWIIDFSKYSNTDISYFKMNYLRLNKETRSKVGNYFIHSIIMVRYKGVGIIDVAITNEPYLDYLGIPIVNKRLFKKYGLPIKTIRGYKDELFHVYFLETIKELNNIAYVRRNPKNGTLKKKGRKDLKRLEYLCNLKKKVNPQLYSDKRCVAYKKYVKSEIGVLTRKSKIEAQAKKVYAVIN